MSTNQLMGLSGFSQAMGTLVENAGRGVVAVKAAAYRTTSGVALGNSLIAVANHSLRREGAIPIQKPDGTAIKATILGRDPAIDLAILKSEAPNETVLAGAESDSIKVGTLAWIVGASIDVGTTASAGIIGARGPARKNWRGGTLDQFLRLDVNFYPSQSGAAVVNVEGKLLGMATPALSRHSTVVIPMTTIERVSAELLEHGGFRQGYLGIRVQPVRVEDQDGQETGLIVLSVESNSPAADAKLLLGDVMLSIDGKRTTDIDDLHSSLRGSAVGKQVPATIVRGGKVMQIELTVAERGKKS
jgi:serine protease Do